MSKVLHILLIDDNDIDLKVNSGLLKLSGIGGEINTFNSCTEAFLQLQKRADELKSKRVVLLLDIQMPSMNGFDCVEKLKDLPRDIRSILEIYMLSSSIDRNDIKRAEEHPDIKKILEKPLDVYQLKRYLAD
jgi:CheY-like chemotaxis protein